MKAYTVGIVRHRTLDILLAFDMATTTVAARNVGTPSLLG